MGQNRSIRENSSGWLWWMLAWIKHRVFVSGLSTKIHLNRWYVLRLGTMIKRYKVKQRLPKMTSFGNWSGWIIASWEAVTAFSTKRYSFEFRSFSMMNLLNPGLPNTLWGGYFWTPQHMPETPAEVFARLGKLLRSRRVTSDSTQLYRVLRTYPDISFPYGGFQK